MIFGMNLQYDVNLEVRNS